MQSDGVCEQPLHGVPEVDRVEDGIHHVRDGAVADVFRIRMMHGVMMRRLQHTDVLQECDQWPVFAPRPVRPLVMK